MTFLVKVVRGKNIGIRMEFRQHYRRGSQGFLFIELVRTGLQTRLQTRLSEKIDFFKRPNNISSHPNDVTYNKK
jgi:hypothetical protein